MASRLHLTLNLMNVLTSIKNQLKQADLPFVDFMQQALYAPLLGYYSAGLQKLGPQGDFITAPELTPLFGQTLAHQCQEILCTLNNPLLLEFGAGSGRLCVDLLSELERQNSLPTAYHILEVSPHLRQEQKILIQQKIPHLLDRIQWLDRWPEYAFNGIMIANEVLDAMPVHRFLQTDEGIFESHVSLNSNNELVELFKKCSNNILIEHIKSIIPKEQQPYQSEVNLFITDWLQQCYDRLEHGALLVLDYGFPRHEYYHPDRNQGTLMCHYHHRAHSNPLIHIGEQDITAHVDFTHVAEAAAKAGFQVTGFTNQASFLLANGILNQLEAITDSQDRFKTTQAVKQLLHPSEMGELFKVMALTKNLDSVLTGFQWHDKRAYL